MVGTVDYTQQVGEGRRLFHKPKPVEARTQQPDVILREQPNGDDAVTIHAIETHDCFRGACSFAAASARWEAAMTAPS